MSCSLPGGTRAAGCLGCLPQSRCWQPAGQGESAAGTRGLHQEVAPEGCRRSDAMHRHGSFLTPITPASESQGDHLWDLTPSSPHPKGCYFIPIAITWLFKLCCFVHGINASDLNLTCPIGTQRLLSCFTLLEFSFIFELGHLYCMEVCALEPAGAPAALGMPCC